MSGVCTSRDPIYMYIGEAPALFVSFYSFDFQHCVFFVAGIELGPSSLLYSLYFTPEHSRLELVMFYCYGSL